MDGEHSKTDKQASDSSFSYNQNRYYCSKNQKRNVEDSTKRRNIRLYDHREILSLKEIQDSYERREKLVFKNQPKTSDEKRSISQFELISKNSHQNIEQGSVVNKKKPSIKITKSHKLINSDKIKQVVIPGKNPETKKENTNEDNKFDPNNVSTEVFKLNLNSTDTILKNDNIKRSETKREESTEIDLRKSNDTLPNKFCRIKTTVGEEGNCLTPNSLSLNLINIMKHDSESSFEDKNKADYMYSNPQLVDLSHTLKESGRKIPNNGATSVPFSKIDERKEYLEEKILSARQEEHKYESVATPFDITSIANNISQEEQAIITNRENSIFPHGIIDPNESEDTPIDTDEIIEFHN